MNVSSKSYNPNYLHIGACDDKPPLDIQLTETNPNHLDVVVDGAEVDPRWGKKLCQLRHKSLLEVHEILKREGRKQEVLSAVKGNVGWGLCVGGVGLMIFGPEGTGIAGLMCTLAGLALGEHSEQNHKRANNASEIRSALTRVEKQLRTRLEADAETIGGRMVTATLQRGWGFSF